MSDVNLNRQKDLLKHQVEIAYAVDAITTVVDQMLAHRASGECPGWMMSDATMGGLVAGITELSRLSSSHAYQLAELQGLDIETVD